MGSYRLADKVVLITGGTGGLGSATARAVLARDGRVGIVDLHPDTAAFAGELSHDRALGLTADVRDSAAMQAAAAAVSERFGRVDVAIANAGVMGKASTLRSTSRAAADTVLDVNVKGVLNTVAASLEQVIAARGQVVLISSVFAYMNGMGAIPYAMSKAAVEQLGRGLRIELAQHGASVVTAYFSLIETDMIHKGVDVDPHALEILSRIPAPLARRINPTEAAEAIVRGIEHRRIRVVRPRAWAPVSLGRGLVSPALDRHFSRHADTRANLRAMELRDRDQHPTAP